MQRVRFTADYDHTWPSRSVTAFKKGHAGPVKDEVAEAAIAAGKAEVDATAGDDTLPGNVMQLQKIVRDEGIDVGDARTVAELQAKITAARADKAKAE